MKDRHALHRTQLNEYKAYCKRKGWSEVPTKGEYETLRMTKMHEPTLIVYDKHRSEYLTIYGISLKMYKEWSKSKGFKQHQQQELVLG